MKTYSRSRLDRAAFATLLLFFCGRVEAAVTVQVVPSVSSPQPVGTVVRLTGVATTSGSGPMAYRFEVNLPGPGEYVMLRDFSLGDAFDWNPNFVEGFYRLRVTARDFQSGETGQREIVFSITSRVVGGTAVVSPTSHPLVALFSAPTCAAGSKMRVLFAMQGSSVVSTTDWKPCRAGSMNFYIAGMRPNQTHVMNYQVETGGVISSGPANLPFVTGSLPSSWPFPQTQVLVPPAAGAATNARIVLTGYFVQQNPQGFPVATDLAGSVVWFYPEFEAQITRPLTGGTMLMIGNGLGTGTGYWGDQTRQWILREIDLAGNTNRETNVDRVNEQLVALGADYIGRFHHDAVRLPNGHTLVFGDVQRIFPAGTQGSSDPIDIIGTMVVTLDQNFQVVGHWNAFDHTGTTQLDINRAPVRGETCETNNLGCVPALLPGFGSAADWLHTNSLQYLPDGNLLMSVRNQDWIIKIDYRDGTGTGDVIWRLGKDGDFALAGATESYPWFSGQHDATFEDPAMQELTLFDNGNSRVLLNRSEYSRGQVYTIDEANRVASLQLNVSLGVFAPLVGSAQKLVNGNYTFQPGYLAAAPDEIYQRTIEVNPSGGIVYMIQGAHASYRSWRLVDFYRSPGP
jgi:hypothetical protein